MHGAGWTLNTGKAGDNFVTLTLREPKMSYTVLRPKTGVTRKPWITADRLRTINQGFTQPENEPDKLNNNCW